MSIIFSLNNLPLNSVTKIKLNVTTPLHEEIITKNKDNTAGTMTDLLVIVIRIPSDPTDLFNDSDSSVNSVRISNV